MGRTPIRKHVAPLPGLPKTIGAFNLIFGGVLLLCGTGCLRTTWPVVTNPALLSFTPEYAKALDEGLRDQVVADLKQKEADATTDADKARLKAERVELEQKRVNLKDQLDYPKINANLKWLPRYLWADVVTGPVLNLLMVFSGTGLLLLKGWARTLGIWVAALKVVRLLALSVFLAGWVVPHVSSVVEDLAGTEVGRAMLNKALEDQKAQQGAMGGGPQLSPAEFLKFIKPSGYSYAILLGSFGSVYPIVALVLLSRPGARAACASTVETEPDSRGDAP